MSDAEIARLRELAAKAKQAEAECLISEERSPGGTVTRIYKHPCSPESSRSVLADSAFSEALVSAWPSLLSRIEAGEKLAEAALALANESSALHAFEIEVRAAISNTNWRCIMDRVEQTRAALAAYSAAKEKA